MLFRLRTTLPARARGAVAFLYFILQLFVDCPITFESIVKSYDEFFYDAIPSRIQFSLEGPQS